MYFHLLSVFGKNGSDSDSSWTIDIYELPFLFVLLRINGIIPICCHIPKEPRQAHQMKANVAATANETLPMGKLPCLTENGVENNWS